MRYALLAIFFCWLPGAAHAGVELTSHSYRHSGSGQIHTVLHIAEYRRGLFFGSCGPSTRSLQWEYSIELTGAGPDFHTREIELKNENCQLVQLQSGSVRMDAKKRRVTITLTMQQGPVSHPFPGNGTFKIKKQD